VPSTRTSTRCQMLPTLARQALRIEGGPDGSRPAPLGVDGYGALGDVVESRHEVVPSGAPQGRPRKVAGGVRPSTKPAPGGIMILIRDARKGGDGGHQGGSRWSPSPTP
jgi:hypothetical protein